MILLRELAISYATKVLRQEKSIATFSDPLRPFPIGKKPKHRPKIKSSR